MSVFVCLWRQRQLRAYGSDDISNCCAGDLRPTLFDQQRGAHSRVVQAEGGPAGFGIAVARHYQQHEQHVQQLLAELGPF